MTATSSRTVFNGFYPVFAATLAVLLISVPFASAQWLSCTSPQSQTPVSIALTTDGNRAYPSMTLSFNSTATLLYRPPLSVNPNAIFTDGFLPSCVLSGTDSTGAISIVSFCRTNLIEAYVAVAPGTSTPLSCLVDATNYNRLATGSQTIWQNSNVFDMQAKYYTSFSYDLDFIGDANMYSNSYYFQVYSMMSAAYASQFFYDKFNQLPGSIYYKAGLRLNSMRYLFSPIANPGDVVTPSVFTALQNLETNNGNTSPVGRLGIYIMSNETAGARGFVKTPIAPPQGLNLAVYQSGFSDASFPRMLDRFGSFISLILNALGANFNYQPSSRFLPTMDSTQVDNVKNSLNQLYNYYNTTANNLVTYISSTTTTTSTTTATTTSTTTTTATSVSTTTAITTATTPYTMTYPSTITVTSRSTSCSLGSTSTSTVTATSTKQVTVTVTASPGTNTLTLTSSAWRVKGWDLSHQITLVAVIAASLLALL